MKNKYAVRSRISAAKIREIVRCFSADLTALQAAQLSGVNRNTINRFYRALRERILWACEAQRPMFGIIEVDESFFGARRVKGKRGRGAYGKTVVFGVFERDGQVYTEIVSDCSKPTLQGIIRGKVDASAVINSDPVNRLWLKPFVMLSAGCQKPGPTSQTAFWSWIRMLLNSPFLSQVSVLVVFPARLRPSSRKRFLRSPRVPSPGAAVP